MLKRIFDILFSFLGLLILFPFLLLLAIFILFDSRGGVFYFQKRVGRNNREFSLMKFRTMVVGADKNGLITVGNNDVRITRIGKFLRKYKIDELPQLINVLIGNMSFVGPRPEVRKYVEMYNGEQRKVLSVRPGLTELASLEYFHENEMLSKTNDPEKTYIEEIMPNKLALNLKYIENQSFFKDLRIIFKTIVKIFS
jgi:lipopolysaccharide/colanic/teichoic acid biosynthesis glycosyltransferase